MFLLGRKKFDYVIISQKKKKKFDYVISEPLYLWTLNMLIGESKLHKLGVSCK